MSLVGPPIANRSSVTGQTKGGSPTHHEDDTIKVVYVTQIGVTRGPTLESGLGLELAGEHLVAGVHGAVLPQVKEFRYLGVKVAGRYLRDRVRSSVTWEELREELLLLLKGDNFGGLDNSLGRCSRHLVEKTSSVELKEVPTERKVWASLLKMLPLQPSSG
ncbi:hypothetical protein D4764_06G0006830 [Takifugu flavidus]|uniref:Uncharacterized protein n=1 Tax=Takifugu flavidus TaxID=433684 RepID=A0A5C6MVX2_9TELE|nr:hypothetical protein D4764_06G0006830 [Takifugu flavidus]